MTPKLICILTLLPLCLVASRAQLISPGELTESHASLDGITNCTSCHKLGVRGIVNQKCLDCHKPLDTRIKAGIGYHTTIVSQNCADCHKEHFGRTFDPVRFDTTSFDHSEAGFELLASHTSPACTDCHTPKNIKDVAVIEFKTPSGHLAKTFLGLSPACNNCHAEDNAHDSQFRLLDCGSCHDEGTWEEAPRFDHGKTEFPLTGKHISTACSDCHSTGTSSNGKKMTIFSPTESGECSTCHADPHQNSFGANCSDCHSTNGFNAIKRPTFEKTFDHGRTSFELIGRHRTVSCNSCHSTNSPAGISIAFQSGTAQKSYPSPIVDDCQSCHLDYHESSFKDLPGGAVCSNCHSENNWTTTSFDIERHNSETEFKLVGAHIATPCSLCHAGPTSVSDKHVFKFDNVECLACHEDSNIHGDQFGADLSCQNCHTEITWSEAPSFDHDETNFLLLGRHRVISCDNCHTSGTSGGQEFTIFRGLTDNCSTCHEADDPHQNQFAGVSCKSCHNEDSFVVSNFDHSSTAFPLSSAHENVLCRSCHIDETLPDGSTFTRFKPVSTRCADCH